MCLKADAELQTIPVVALTACAMPREQARAAGCTGHTEKPIDTQNFNAQVSAFLGAAPRA